jgi:hypothetical protein
MTDRLVNTLSGRLSLREPQRESLEILALVTELLKPSKDTDPASALRLLQSEFARTRPRLSQETMTSETMLHGGECLSMAVSKSSQILVPRQKRMPPSSGVVTRRTTTEASAGNRGSIFSSPTTRYRRI